MLRQDRRSEWLADAAIHIAGLMLGIAGCGALAAAALPSADPPLVASLALYAAGLLAMLGCSALYHLTGNGPWKGVFRRLDHAAIFVMIAGTYTPFSVLAIEGAWGTGLLVFVWTVAAAGVVQKLLYPGRFERASIAVYLLLGWSGLVALNPLSVSLSPPGLALLAAGGILYSVGVLFHLWTRLPYHRAIWHGFVLSAAGCHYAAILGDLVIAR